MQKLEKSLFRSFLRYANNLKKSGKVGIYLQHRLNPQAEVSWLYFDCRINNQTIVNNMFVYPESIKEQLVSDINKRLGTSRWIDGETLGQIFKNAYRIPLPIPDAKEEKDDGNSNSNSNAVAHAHTTTQHKYKRDRSERIDFAMDVLRELHLLGKLSEQTSVITDHPTGLVITCTSLFSEQDSQLQYSNFTHYYRILIENQGEEPVQLINRSWIFCGDGTPPVILPRWAPGVVGEKPLLSKGEGFHYMSSTRIGATNGYMEGTFQFSDARGKLFEVPIGRCALTDAQFM